MIVERMISVVMELDGECIGDGSLAPEFAPGVEPYARLIAGSFRSRDRSLTFLETFSPATSLEAQTRFERYRPRLGSYEAGRPLGAKPIARRQAASWPM